CFLNPSKNSFFNSYSVMRKLMAPKKQTFILTISMFLVATLLTMKQQALVDGRNEYGFPFRFYTFSYCKDIECIEQLGFDLISFTYDILITTTVALLIVKLKHRFYRPLLILFAFYFFSSCKSTCDCSTIDRKAKGGETLFNICKYVVKNNKVTEPADPCSWKI